MAYDTSKLASLQNLKDVATRIKKEYLAAISKAGHASFQKSEAVPEVSEAQENILYLVKNAETGFYDVYALVDGAVERIDDTSVDLEGYVTDEELTAALEGLGGGALYEGTKTDLTATDGSVIEAYFAEHTDIVLKQGDVFVVTTIVDGKEYAKSAYSYTGTDWEAMTGNVDADKVIMSEDLMLAGDYDRIGNWTKDKNGTLNKEVAGKSVLAVLKEITSKTLQPTITAQPSIPSFSLTGAAAVEAGTKVNPASYSGASLNAGSYKYGPATGVVASNWKVERITNAGTVEIANVDAATLTAGTDNNDGNGFIIGDQGGDNVVSSLKYRATATHGAGVQAQDNLGGASNPAVAIAAGTKTKDTSAYTPYRNIFYGATAAKPDLNSEYIRTLTKSGNAYSARTFKIEVAAGAQRVAIACISGKTGVTKIINESAMNADVTATFDKSTVKVEGANGYTAVEYNVWVFEPAKPYENSATLAVTLG